MKKVVSIVLNNFKNDSRVLKENISLQNAGYDVQVVALWEDGVKEQEIIQNIPVHRVKLKSKNWSKNKFVQLIKYFEFLYKASREYKNTDIIHCNDLNALPVGVIIKKFYNKNIKIVYDAHEHESYRAGYSPAMQKISRWWERKLIKYANKVITVSCSIADDYEKMYNIPKPAIVLNAPFYKETKKQDIFREKFNIPKDDIIFLYQGGLSKERGILELARLINGISGISYIIMGYGILEDEIMQFAQNSKNVYFHQAVSPEVLLDYTSSADIGVCIEKPICRSWDYALPNKMFEYLHANLVLLVGGLRDMKDFVRNNNIGFIIESYEELNNQEIFNQKLEYLKANYKNKLQNVKEKAQIFNWQKQEKILLQFYKELENVE